MRLSRNKSRDEREMWPNRSSHTDTASERQRESRGALASPGPPWATGAILASRSWKYRRPAEGDILSVEKYYSARKRFYVVTAAR